MGKKSIPTFPSSYFFNISGAGILDPWTGICKGACKVRRNNCFHLSKEKLRCCFIQLRLPSLAGMTHFDHTQQPNNSRFAAAQTLNVSVAAIWKNSSSGVPSHWCICISLFFASLQAADSRDSTCLQLPFDARSPVGAPSTFCVGMHKPSCTPVSQNQGKGILLLQLDCSTLPLKDVCKAVAAYQR